MSYLNMLIGSLCMYESILAHTAGPVLAELIYQLLEDEDVSVNFCPFVPSTSPVTPEIRLLESLFHVKTVALLMSDHWDVLEIDHSLRVATSCIMTVFYSLFYLL